MYIIKLNEAPDSNEKILTASKKIFEAVEGLSVLGAELLLEHIGAELKKAQKVTPGLTPPQEVRRGFSL